MYVHLVKELPKQLEKNHPLKLKSVLYLIEMDNMNWMCAWGAQAWEGEGTTGGDWGNPPERVACTASLIDLAFSEKEKHLISIDFELIVNSKLIKPH